MLAEKLKYSLSINEDVSNLLLECQTVCRYLDILNKYMWLVYELNGYTHLENMQSNEVNKIIPNYRLVIFTLYRIDNQPIIMNNTFSQLFSIHPVLVGCVEFENNIEFTITSSDYID